MTIRALLLFGNILLLTLCVILQVSAMPLVILGVPVVIHLLFFMIVFLIFLKEWQWSLFHFFFGTILITQLSEEGLLPVIVSYAVGATIFLFLSDFLLKSRSAFTLTINVLCAVFIMLTLHQILLHVAVKTSYAILSRDDIWFLFLTTLMHMLFAVMVSYAVLLIDRAVHKRDIYA